jgi:regulator of protease activity HflC (stomatin/prohibitin superfamily)
VTALIPFRIVPQARAGVIERFGRYLRTLSPSVALQRLAG